MRTHRKEWESARRTALTAAAEAHDGYRREWWLSRCICVTAELAEVNTHVGGEHYRTEPRMSVTWHFSDSGRQDERHVVSVNELEPWQILALVRLKRQWAAWCANELAEMPPGIPGPEYVWREDRRLPSGGSWVSVWPDGNPWPESRDEVRT